LDQTAKNAASKPPILAIIAGATLILSYFTPLLLLSLPIMATVGLCIAAAFRKETPRAAPHVVGAFAVLLLVWAHLPHGFAQVHLSNGLRYDSATWVYGSAIDPMRKTTGKWATLDSPTELNFAAPYDGDNRAEIEVDSTGGLTLIVGSR
jgi:fumarate reductase subunit D